MVFIGGALASSKKMSAGKWGYGLVAHGKVIFQSLKNNFQRLKFAGKSRNSAEKNDSGQISGPKTCNAFSLSLSANKGRGK